MKSYVDLLGELKSKIIDLQKPIIATAKEYIPKLYHAILNENPHLTPIEARNKIIKDCKTELWSHRTILAALPDEAKNLEKQKAGKQRHKNKNKSSAAISAAPEEKIVTTAVNEEPRYSIELEDLINENYELKQIIRKNAELKTANNIKSEYGIFTISKENFSLFIAIIEKSKDYFQVKFDKEGVLVDVQADILQENYK